MVERVLVCLPQDVLHTHTHTVLATTAHQYLPQTTVLAHSPGCAPPAPATPSRRAPSAGAQHRGPLRR
jgi:hypothetical protein